jgi:hypothetical protein
MCFDEMSVSSSTLFCFVIDRQVPWVDGVFITFKMPADERDPVVPTVNCSEKDCAPCTCSNFSDIIVLRVVEL